MKEASLINQFFKYVSYSIFAMISLSCYILADTFFVSKGIGIGGLASLNLALPIFSFVSGIGLLIGIGGATVFSLANAGGNSDRAKSAFLISIMLGVAISVILAVVGLTSSRELAIMLGAKADIIANTAVYVKYILIFAPAFILNNILIPFVRNNGRPKVAMFAMILGSFSNIILDYVFIFPCKMGMFGAVLATGLAPIISMVVLLPFILKDSKSLFTVRIPRSEIKLMGQIVRTGLPSFIAEFSSGLVMLAFNYVILKLVGNIGVASYGVIANISLVCVAVFTGIAQGCQPLFSKNFGSNNYGNVKILKRYATALAVILGILLYAVIIIFREQIQGVFNSDNIKEFELIATQGMVIYFTALPLIGINIVTAMYFSSTNSPKQAFTIAVLRGLILIILSVIILGNLIGMVGVWLALPVTEGITAIFSLYFILRKNKKSVSEKIELG